jgi:hypothetical protein
LTSGQRLQFKKLIIRILWHFMKKTLAFLSTSTVGQHNIFESPCTHCVRTCEGERPEVSLPSTELQLNPPPHESLRVGGGDSPSKDYTGNLIYICGKSCSIYIMKRGCYLTQILLAGDVYDSCLFQELLLKIAGCKMFYKKTSHPLLIVWEEHTHGFDAVLLSSRQ